MTRKLVCIAAIPILVVGCVTLPMPIPTGAVMICVSVAMLVWGSDRVAASIRTLRIRRPGFDRTLRRVVNSMPQRLRGPVISALERSDPEFVAKKRAEPEESL